MSKAEKFITPGHPPESARDFLQNTLEGGKLSVTSGELLKFMDSLHALQDPPEDYVIESQTILAQAHTDHVKLQVAFVIHVLSDRWCRVKLLNETVSVEKSVVNGAAPGFFGMSQGRHCLFTEQRGRYEVTMDGICSYTTDRNCGVKLHVPQASRSFLRFVIPLENVSVSIAPSVAFEQNTRDSTTTVECSFPATRELSVQWTTARAEAVAPVEAKQEEMVVTVTQQTLCTLGEGVLNTTSLFDYRIVHGTKSDFQIALDPLARVIELTGAGVRRWDVQHNDAPSTAPKEDSGVEESSSVEEGASTLCVWLDRAVEGSYRLTLLAERDLPSTSCEVSLPAYSCVGVNKERGFVGVEARTNVEIEEIHVSGVAKIDVHELPVDLTLRASRPVLHAYKFLVPRFNIQLDVKKHADIDVLIAVVDQGWVEFVVAEDQLLTRATLKVRNTQRQYLRVTLPNDTCSVWSVVVGGVAVKPSSDEDKKVLIPLDKSGSEGSDRSFWVEFVYLTKIPLLQKKGKITIDFPAFDLPINHLFVSTYLPHGFKYGDIDTKLHQVQSFTEKMPDMVSTSSATESEDYRPKRVEKMQRQVAPMMSNIMMATPQGFIGDESAEEYSEPEPAMPTSKGVLPVRIQTPQTGILHRFERLLVMTDAPRITVPYRRIPPYSRWHRFRNSGWFKFTLVLVAAIALLVVMMQIAAAPVIG